MHKSSLDKMLAFRKKYLDSKKNEALLILDLGSLDVNGSYREYFDVFSWTYSGIDMAPGNNVDIVLKNPYNWREIKSNSVDVLISGQAFEHIEFCWITMLEIARVLRPGGMCCIIAPSGGPEHRYPVEPWEHLWGNLDDIKSKVDRGLWGHYMDLNQMTLLAFIKSIVRNELVVLKLETVPDRNMKYLSTYLNKIQPYVSVTDLTVEGISVELSKL